MPGESENLDPLVRAVAATPQTSRPWVFSWKEESLTPVEVLVGAFGVEPGDPLGGAEFDVVDVAPGALAADELVLERPDRGLGQRVIERIANRPDRPDRRIDPFVDQAAA
jgi:hypothetical protein